MSTRTKTKIISVFGQVEGVVADAMVKEGSAKRIDPVCDARMEIERLRESLDRYRYACAFASADSWDGGIDIRQRFEWARANDPGSNMEDNQIAWWGQKFLKWAGRR